MSRLLVIVFCLGLVACDPLEPTTPQAPEELDSSDSAPLTSKPMAPVELSYQLHQKDGGLALELDIRSSHLDVPVYASLRTKDGALLVERQTVTMTRQVYGRAGELRFHPDEDALSRGLLLQVDVEMEQGTLSRTLALPTTATTIPSAMEKAQVTEATQPERLFIQDQSAAVLISLPADEVSR